MIGPLVPSETCRRYHPEAWQTHRQRCPGAWGVGGSYPRFERVSPLYMEVLSLVGGRWSQHRVSEGIATNAVTPTHVSRASRKSGLLPYRQSATTYLNGSSPSCAMVWSIAAANCGFVCQVTSSGTLHLARLWA